jgi:hypothetical protein
MVVNGATEPTATIPGRGAQIQCIQAELSITLHCVRPLPARPSMSKRRADHRPHPRPLPLHQTVIGGHWITLLPSPIGSHLNCAVNEYSTVSSLIGRVSFSNKMSAAVCDFQRSHEHRKRVCSYAIPLDWAWHHFWLLASTSEDPLAVCMHQYHAACNKFIVVTALLRPTNASSPCGGLVAPRSEVQFMMYH